MARLAAVVLALVLLFGSVLPSSAWAEAAAESPSVSDSLWDTVIQGVGALFWGESQDAGPVVPEAAAAAAAPTQAQTQAPPKVQPQTQVQVVRGPTAAELEAALAPIVERLHRIDRRSGQSRDIGWAVLALAVAMSGLLVLGLLGRFGLTFGANAADQAVLRELRRIRKRQDVLASALGQLQDIAVQSYEERDQFHDVLAAVADQVHRLNDDVGEVYPRRD